MEKGDILLVFLRCKYCDIVHKDTHAYIPSSHTHRRRGRGRRGRERQTKTRKREREGERDILAEFIVVSVFSCVCPSNKQTLQESDVIPTLGRTLNIHRCHTEQTHKASIHSGLQPPVSMWPWSMSPSLEI